ncbi:MAG TPA: sigma-70 family RNA polymerase sigma factor [Thermoanaerobaculia bacterium]|nr:sigma-70 family RNA polymerase sigma factor [Thermoanaerobaculia bacterium]
MSEIWSGERRSDEELAAAASRGSEEAFRELVERFERPVYGLVLRIVRRNDLAEDLAQETFVKAWKALGRFDPSRKFSSWLFKIAHNSALDALRRRGEEPLSLDAPAAEGEPARELPADPRAENPLARTTFRAAGRALEAALAELRPQYREILVLRFVEGLAYEEIAEVTGSPLGTVKVHIFRARQELAKKMAALGWDPETLGS